MDKQQKKIYARKGLVFPHNQESDRVEGKGTGPEQNLTVDDLINTLMKSTSKGVWSTCTLCGVRVKDGNMVNHVSRVPPETIRG